MLGQARADRPVLARLRAAKRDSVTDLQDKGQPGTETRRGPRDRGLGPRKLISLVRALDEDDFGLQSGGDTRAAVMKYCEAVDDKNAVKSSVRNARYGMHIAYCA